MGESKLAKLDDFKKILADYRPSQRAIQALDGLNLVLMVGLSSSGRNTLIKNLLKTGNFYFIVSDTTRAPQFRDGKMEQNGVNYFFRSEQDILADLKAGEFLEAAVIHNQQVSGISIRELERAKHQSKTAITDIEIVGAENIVQVKPDAKAIFLLPPSFDEWMKRIVARSQMSTEELKNRMASAEHELEAALSRPYYNFVISEDVDQSVQIIKDVVVGQKSLHQSRGRQLAQDLYNDLKAKLSTS